MGKTVLITGCSSGIGQACANFFLKKGWHVTATVRNNKDAGELSRFTEAFPPVVDVTKPSTIQKAVNETVRKFGNIDVLVNNAGIGIEGPFESFSIREVKEIFETNFFGTLNTIQAVLPQMKKQKHGVIVNISSMGGRLTFPYYSAYHSSKWAVEGFTESLQYELAPLGITVKLIEPGVINTQFFRKMTKKSNKHHDSVYLPKYETMKIKKLMVRKHASSPEKVATTVFRAATDGSLRLRYIVGLDAHILMLLKQRVPEQWLYLLIKHLS